MAKHQLGGTATRRLPEPRLAAAASEPRPGVDVQAALNAPRILIERLSPLVDAGRYPARAVVGQCVTVEADVFMDGHDELAAELLWRAASDARPHHVPMQPIGSDRWRATFTPDAVGRYHFTIQAGLDVWRTYRGELAKKHAAGVPTSVEVEEGRRLVRAAQHRAHGEVAAAIARLSEELAARGSADARDLLLAEATDTLMSLARLRRFETRLAPEAIVAVERRQALFASWYELFPRSQTHDAAAHGTFDDVIGRLPAIRAMGFDVLYFPPIHPIGTTHRKGRNNALRAAPGDPGSPYAIGSAEGGHDAVHPQLGGLAAFRRLRDAAQDLGIELALDLAVQFSPDHPWLKAHPDWFSWRPDGSLRYAENPPKKYEDIVTADFYAPAAAPALWLALRDVVEHWIGEGVRTFRVDNPHTKPLPFWEWLIADVRARHDDVLFLSEAFTRPAMMYALAKIGFSQSYTYFTWRNAKHELAEYLAELTTQAPKDFFRPHLFVNTPDINPYFLQGSGRAGFLIRAALAATLSGLWGVYSGFELCESEPVPGKEEYLDSEKYQVKPRDWTAPGNIVREISHLNRLRRENAALQTHLGLAFYHAWNDQVLCYGKRTPDRSNFILVGVSLDPHHVQEARFEIPLWEFGLPDDGALEVEELMGGGRFTWRGKVQHWRFIPWERPFAVWRVQPARA